MQDYEGYNSISNMMLLAGRKVLLYGDAAIALTRDCHAFDGRLRRVRSVPTQKPNAMLTSWRSKTSKPVSHPFGLLIDCCIDIRMRKEDRA